MHFAKVVDGFVTQVIVADEKFIEEFDDHSPGVWLRTSYNTRGNQHLAGGVPLRGNFAGVGYSYDADRDVFIPPCPGENFRLDEATFAWVAPNLTEDEAQA